jgi:hypothetical protein
LGWPGTTVIAFLRSAIGNSVWLFGYPTSLANDDLDLKTPLLRAGIVAGITKRHQIVLDCPSYFGNSGGLAVELVDERQYGIGVAIKMVPFGDAGVLTIILASTALIAS